MKEKFKEFIKANWVALRYMSTAEKTVTFVLVGIGVFLAIVLTWVL